jgi:hypothetical protein
MTKHTTTKRISNRWIQAATLVVIGGLAGVANAANTASFLFFSQGLEQPYSISNVVGSTTKRSTGAGVCNSLGAGVDVRTISSTPAGATVHVQSDLLASCSNGFSGGGHVDGTNTSSADNILWCFLIGAQGSQMQAGVGIFN